MRYAQIRSFDISNGEGIGTALFVQGCHFHCKDCFNENTWDFDGGYEWSKEIEEKFVELSSKEYIQRISVLGGEPLANENIQCVSELIIELKEKFPQKKIWVYTGYTFEEIYNLNILQFIDVLCDGRFITDMKDPLNKDIKWVGSMNQRVIDVKETIKQKEIILYE